MRAQSQLGQALYLGLKGECVGEVGKRIAPPQTKGFAQSAGGCGRVATQLPARLTRSRLEACCVNFLISQVQDVAGRAAFQALGAEGAAQVRDVALKRRTSRVGRLVAPDLIDQPVGRDNLVRPNDEMRQNQALFGSTESETFVVLADLEWTKYADVHR